MNTELKKELQALRERIAELEKQCETASDSPTWENVAVGKKGWCIGVGSSIFKNKVGSHYDLNTFPTREHAEAVLAESQLMWLRDNYRNSWKPVVHHDSYNVCFTEHNGLLQLFVRDFVFYSDDRDLFAFQDKATAERFLNEQRPLLETYFKKFSL
jgi:hypothetical protein